MRPSPHRSRFAVRAPVVRKALALGAICVLAVASAVIGSVPASAATTQTSSCTDGGGVRWSGKAIWGGTSSTSGITKVIIDYAGWTTSRSGTVPTDSAVRSYDGAGNLVKSLTWTGPFNYVYGTAYQSRNPENPPSAPGASKVTVTLGVDGDGFGNCTMTFTQPGGTNPPPVLTASDRYEADVVTTTNQERTSRGITALTTQTCVNQFANTHAARMASEKRMYHQDLGPILTVCNLNGVGENVAYGYASGTAVTAGWMGSAGHRQNILNPSYRLLGVGAAQDADGRWYAAQVFGYAS